MKDQNRSRKRPSGRFFRLCVAGERADPEKRANLGTFPRDRPPPFAQKLTSRGPGGLSLSTHQSRNPTVHELNISLRLGKMALDHQAKPGKYLIQEAETGAWMVESNLRRTSLLARLAAISFWKRRSFQITAALAAGVLCTLGLNNLSGQQSALPFASPAAPHATAPQSISLAPATYATDPIDLSKLPPPIAEPDASLSEPAQASETPSQQVPAAATTPVTPPAAPSLKQPPAVVPASAGASKIAQVPAKPLASPLPAPIRPPMPSPVAAVKAPDRKVPAAAPVKPPANPSADDAKMAVFNEPALQLAKPNGGPAAEPSTGGAVPVPGIVSSGPVHLTPKVGSTAPASKTGVRMLAVQDPSSIVVTNPATRLPMVVKVGQSLPDGSTLKSVDKTALTALTSKGDQLVLH